MEVRAFSEKTFFSALALRRSGRGAAAERLLGDLAAYAAGLRDKPAKVDYFATSLPTMLLFDDDLQLRQILAADVMTAQAALGTGDVAMAQSLLGAVLNTDPNHALAAELLEDLTSADPVS